MTFRFGRKQRDPEGLDPATASPEQIQLQVTRLMFRDRQRDRAFRLSRLAIIFLFPSIWAFYAHFALSSRVPTGPLFSSGPQLAIVSLSGNVGEGLARADSVVPALRRAFGNTHVKAIALMIDSPGGSPIEAERINQALGILKKEHPKQVIAVVNSLGASAAYLIAMHADKIVAGRYSLVGSIGAVIDSWDFSGALSKVDVRQRVYASGDLKAMLNPFVPSSQLADEKAQTLVNTLAQQFLHDLKAERGTKLVAGMKYDTGEVWDGASAKRIGLVDEIGTIETVQAELQQVTPDLEARSYGPGNPSVGTGLTSKIADVLSEAMTKAVSRVSIQ
ncbi:S49 family peptidase [Burkholderia sp. MBR-1]|uniref:S49 family peptidase n=1 Tax=Burkholderia sp. MBR-1 TaxID=2732364 RepID=UPI0015EF599F|nr:S49 family peptidase [Burkholderia sp. MBR-1]QMI49683.1 S49 family peptidase [Burkholderia sp. MBR-1]